MMRVGIDALSVIPAAVGGSEIYIYELTRSLLEMDSSNEYFLFLSHANEARFRTLQYPNLTKEVIRYPGNSRLFRIARQQLSLPRYLKELKIDVCHYPGTTMTLSATCPSVLTVQSLHCYLFPHCFSAIRRKYLRYMTAASVRRADAIIVPSEYCRTQTVDLLKAEPERVFVVPEGIRVSDFGSPDMQLLSQFGLKPGEYVFCPCHFLPYKNLENAIRAYHLIKSREYLPHKFVIAGCISDRRYYDKIQSLVRTLGLGEDLIYVGSLPHHQMPTLYRGATFCVYPSVSETFGLPVLESMACGTPVICSNRSSLPEVGGKAALLVDPTDPIRLSRAMRHVIQNAAVRQMLVQDGLQHVRRFGWENAAIGTLEVFNRLMQVKRGQRT
jgi:glycosyltransferase involved in cell wall biosynthesis